MKSRSYYALVLLLSCVAPITTIRATDSDEVHHRAGSVIEAHSLAELNQIIANNKNVVVDIYGSWCGPCKKMAPEFAKLPSAFSDIIFVKIEVGSIGNAFGVRSIPTLICFKDGQNVSQVAGAKSFNDLKNYVSSIFN